MFFFGRLGVIHDSQATNRSASGGRGALTGSPPYFLLVASESYRIPSRTATHFFIAMRIRVNYVFIGKLIILWSCANCHCNLIFFIYFVSIHM